MPPQVVECPNKIRTQDRAQSETRTRRPAAKRAAEDDVMMTDEQYIDALFTTEPCGYEKTPGFRDFLLELMATIGERPRAGDVAQMHLAYCAGMEQAKS